MQSEHQSDKYKDQIERDSRLLRRVVIFGLISGIGLVILGLFVAKDDEMVYTGLGIMVMTMISLGIAKAG